MAIYKSSFNKKPDKNKDKKDKVKKEKQIVEKPAKVHHVIKINKAAIILTAFSILFLICILPNNFVKNFVLGCIGLLIYPICIIGIFFSVCVLMKKRFKVKKKYLAYLTSSVLIIWFVFHLILTSKLNDAGFTKFLIETYKAKTTAGGILFSIISYPIVQTITIAGAYVFSFVALAIFVGLIIDYISTERTLGHAEKRTKFDFKNIEEFEIDEAPKKEIPKEEQAKKLAKRRLGLEKGETTIISSNMPNLDINSKMANSRPLSKREYILTPVEPVIPPEKTEDLFTDNTSGYKNAINLNRQNNEEIIKPIFDKKEEIKPIEENKFMPKAEDSITTNFANRNSSFDYDKNEKIQKQEDFDDIILDDGSDDEFDNLFDDLSIEDNENVDNYNGKTQNINDYQSNKSDFDIEDVDFNNLQDIEEDDMNEIVKGYEKTQSDYQSIHEINITNSNHNYVDEYAYNEPTVDLPTTENKEIVLPSLNLSKFNLPNVVKKVSEVKYEQIKLEDVRQAQEIPPYCYPPVELLNYIENPETITEEQIQDNIDRLEQVLEDFKVPAKVNNVQVGPAVTRYELTMPRGISVNKIAQMADDIAMTLASNGSIRVEAPIPGKNSVGIEVPNDKVGSVSLRELIDSQEFRMRGNPMSFVLGKDINGDIIFCNLDKMPHLLIAGSTGSGKSVCMNTMLLSLCYKAGPQDLRLILVDPKMVEFANYTGLPHLLIPDIITNKDKVINALDWCIKEMERRYSLFAKNHVVNINEYNRTEFVRVNKNEKLPFIVLVIDELADLMLEAKREIEDKIAKLTAKARAAGIHLVLATQRPSVDVITGTIKANLPSRIAFSLTNFVDSRTVIDQGGAEKLLGRGDMLFKPQDQSEPRRVQGAYVSAQEIISVIKHIKENNNPIFDDGVNEAFENPNGNRQVSRDNVQAKEQEFDPILKEALRMFIQIKQASGSMISRRYSVGYNRAGRIMDQMEQAGFIGAQDGAKPRTVLITLEEYKAIFGDED